MILADLPADMPDTRQRWRSVERARETLDRNANRLMKAMIKKAIAGDAKAAAWLLAHTSVVKDGAELRPIATGIDRPLEQSSRAGDNGPRILIGVSLGADFARLNAQLTDRPGLPPAAASHPVPIDAQIVNSPSK